ncbi:FeoB-associated Cys-rich membrane protein [bacterium]|nr:FeoB-associated Cys-rich membrane protein [bacterium]
MWQEVLTALIILAAIAYVIVAARSRRSRAHQSTCADGCCGCPHARTPADPAANCCPPPPSDSPGPHR